MHAVTTEQLLAAIRLLNAIPKARDRKRTRPLWEVTYRELERRALGVAS